jgi:hypothetical protein
MLYRNVCSQNFYVRFARSVVAKVLYLKSSRKRHLTEAMINDIS